MQDSPLIIMILFFRIRFDHYATLCELLPAALPSLAYCLQALRTGNQNKYRATHHSLAPNSWLVTQILRQWSYVAVYYFAHVL